MSLVKKPVFWVGVLALSAIAWVATAPDTAAKRTTTVRATQKKSPSKKTVIQFTKEDFEIEFKPVNAELKNAFQPIVIRKSGSGSGDGAANVIPVDFTGGDAGWVYTGNAEIDGTAMALFENRTTGEGVFLKAGERWKSAALNRIMPDSVVMAGPSGIKTFALINEEPRMSRNAFNPASVNVPAGMRGQVGNPMGGRGQNGNMRNGQSFQMLPDAGGGGMVTIPADSAPGIVFAPGE